MGCSGSVPMDDTSQFTPTKSWAKTMDMTPETAVTSPSVDNKINSRESISEIDYQTILNSRGKVASFMNIDRRIFESSGLSFEDIPNLPDLWKLCSKRGETSVYSCEISGSDWIGLRAETYIEASRDDLARLMLNDYRTGEYDEYTAESKILRTITDRIVVRRLATKSLWPASHRDFVTISIWDELADGSILICNRAVEDSLCPVQKGYVRGFLLCGGCWLRPSGRGCKMTLVAHTDLGGAVPAAAANVLAYQGPLKIIAGYEAAMKRPSKLSGLALDVDLAIRCKLRQSRMAAASCTSVDIPEAPMSYVGIAVAAVQNESSNVNLSIRDRSRSRKFTSFDGKLVLGALVATLWSVVIVHFFSAFIAGTL